MSLFPSTTDRDPLDFNRTPAWVVELLLPQLEPRAHIVDAGCGDGAIGLALRSRWPTPYTQIVGIELDIRRSNKAWETSAYTEVFLGDWLDETSRSYAYGGHRPDLIISNPPFGLAALDFLRCAIARVRPGGTVAFLLPTHWDHASWTAYACPMAAKDTRSSRSSEAGRTHAALRSVAVRRRRRIATPGSCLGRNGLGSRVGDFTRYRHPPRRLSLK